MPHASAPLSLKLAIMEGSMSNSRNKFRIVRGGKEAYLSFIRNLTPQILLFSFVYITGRQLDFTKIDLNNIMPTALFYTLLLSFCLAVYCSIFLNALYPNKNKWVDSYIKKAKAIKNSKLYVFYFLVLAVVRKRYIACIELFLVMFFLQITVAAVIVAAVKSAIAMSG